MTENGTESGAPESQEEVTLPRAIILHDKPTSTDEFEGNGHQRSAAALAEAVQQMADRDGAIGLEGKWGAGKSSVVNLAEVELKKHNGKHVHHHLMCYDLWAHQSDIFRRSFLEELLQWCGTGSKESTSNGKPLLKENQVEEFRDKIRDRIKKVTYEVDRSFSLLGIIFVLFGPLLPVMIAWLSPFAFSNAVEAETTRLWFKAGWGFPAALAFTGAIYIALAIRIVWARFWKKKKKNSEKRTWAKAIASTAAISRNEVEDRTETQNIRDEDPSSLEFQRLFREILSAAQSEKDRIVFVFDNIDRLPTEQIVDRWAEMRSVFAVSDPDGDKPETSVTAIVPYDAQHIAAAMTSPSPIKVVEQVGGLKLVQQPLDKGAKEAAELISKTFDLTVRVAPPVSTDWENFFYAKLAEAFKEANPENSPITDTVRFRVFKLFDESKRNSQSHPTPRQIIAYINSIGTLWNQWKGIIPLESLALYTLFRTDIEHSPDAILNPHMISPTYVRITDQEDWQTQLAALVFNVDLDKAGQVLLGPKIRTALEEEDSEALNELAENPIFESALCDEVTARSGHWSRDNLERLTSAVRSLYSLDLESEASDLCWRTLGDSLEELHPADAGSYEDYQSLSFLIGKRLGKSPVSVARTLVNWSLKTTLSVEQYTVEHGRKWFDFFEAILRELRPQVQDETLKTFKKYTTYPQNEKFALGVAIASAYSNLVEFSDFGGNIDQAKLDQGISDLALTNPDTVEAIAQKANPALSKGAMEAIAQNIATELRTKNNLSVELAKHYALLLITLRTKGAKVDENLGSLSDDGTLAWHRHQAEKLDEQEVAALFHFLITLVRPLTSVQGSRPNPHPQLGDMAEVWQSLGNAYGENHDNEKYETELARLVTAQGLFASWANMALQEEHWGIHSRTFLSAVRSGELGSFRTGEIVSLYPDLEAMLEDDDLEKLVRLLGNRAQHFSKYFSDSTLLDFPAKLLKDAKRFNIESYKDISNQIQSYFSNLNSEAWLELLRNNENGVELLHHQIKEDNFTIPVAEFRPAVLKLMVDVLTEDFTLTVDTELYDSIPLAVPSASKSRIRKDFINSLDDEVVTGNGVHDFLDAFPTFASEVDLAENPNLLLGRIVLPLIESRKDSASGYAKDKASQMLSAFASASEETQQQIQEAIQTLHKSDDDAVSAWAEELRATFNLPEFSDESQNGAEEPVRPSSDTEQVD